MDRDERGWRVEWKLEGLQIVDVAECWLLPKELLRDLSWGEVRSRWWKRDL